MIVRWTTLAKSDLERIYEYIAADNQPAALRVIRQLYNAVHTQLLLAPLSGRVGRVASTRELVFSNLPYIIAYRVWKGELQVLRVLHTALRWPETMDEG